MAEAIGSDRVIGVRLTDGRVLPADVVIVGLGVVPDTGWLEGSGLVLDDGVVCDATLLAAPGIVAAGDVARWPDTTGQLRRLEHWDNAIQQGRHAATRLVEALEGRPGTTYERSPWMWSDQYGTKVQLFGSARAHDEAVVVHRDDTKRSIVVLFRCGDRLGGAGGLNASKRLLGYRRLVAAGASWREALGDGAVA